MCLRFLTVLSLASLLCSATLPAAPEKSKRTREDDDRCSATLPAAPEKSKRTREDADLFSASHTPLPPKKRHKTDSGETRRDAAEKALCKELDAIAENMPTAQTKVCPKEIEPFFVHPHKTNETFLKLHQNAFNVVQNMLQCMKDDGFSSDTWNLFNLHIKDSKSLNSRGFFEMLFAAALPTEMRVPFSAVVVQDMNTGCLHVPQHNPNLDPLLQACIQAKQAVIKILDEAIGAHTLGIMMRNATSPNTTYGLTLLADSAHDTKITILNDLHTSITTYPTPAETGMPYVLHTLAFLARFFETQSVKCFQRRSVDTYFPAILTEEEFRASSFNTQKYDHTTERKKYLEAQNALREVRKQLFASEELKALLLILTSEAMQSYLMQCGLACGIHVSNNAKSPRTEFLEQEFDRRHISYDPNNMDAALNCLPQESLRQLLQTPSEALTKEKVEELTTIFCNDKA